MILRRIIVHFRKPDPLPFIPAQAGTQRAPEGAHAKSGASNCRNLDPGLRRDERMGA